MGDLKVVSSSGQTVQPTSNEPEITVPSELQLKPEDRTANSSEAMKKASTENKGHMNTSAEYLKKTLGEQLRMDATTHDLVDKVRAAGIRPEIVKYMAAKLGALAQQSSAEFDYQAALIRDALSTANPERLEQTLLNLGKTNDGKPQLVQDYPIRPGSEDSIKTNVKTVTDYVGDTAQRRLQGSSTVNGAGLKDYLTKINGGRALTDFEKNLAAQWNNRTDIPVLTPIYKIGSDEVEAYKVETGQSGNKFVTVYDRNGKQLSRTNAEPGLEGKDPIMEILLARAGAGGRATRVSEEVGEAVAKKTAGKEVATAAGAAEAKTTVAGAEAEAAAASRIKVDPHAKTQVDPHAKTQPGAKADPHAKTDPGGKADPYAKTQPAKSVETVDTGGTQDTGPSKSSGSSEASRRWGKGDQVGPKTPVNPKGRAPLDHEMVTVKTSRGSVEMTAGEYRRKVKEADAWIKEQGRQGHATSTLVKTAAEKFGLDNNWSSVANPIVYGKI